MNQQGNGAKIFSFPDRSSDPLRKRLFTIASTVAESMLLLQHLNSIYTKISAKKPIGLFLKDTLYHLNIRYSLTDSDRERIPPQGPLVVVANHPFGAVEGIILADILLSRRPDVRIMANHLLGRIPEMRELLILVDPFGSVNALRKNIRPLKEAVRWLQGGGTLGIFPGGGVSHLRILRNEITDPHWSDTVAGIIRKTGASVIPIYFDGANSMVFQLAGLIHPRFRTALLPRELLNKRSKEIRVHVGKPICFDRLNALQTNQEMISYLRFRTYALRHRKGELTAVKGGHVSSHGKKASTVSSASRTMHEGLIQCEVQRLDGQHILLENRDFCVFHAQAHEIPNLLQEIGRLREQTFRLVGEGTGKAVDLDRFDLYYTHLFLWNKQNKEIVGAYRLGDVDSIVRRHGVHGLYTSSLFHYRPAFLSHINNALELGRSFVRPEYQRQYSSLFFLWKGIGHFVARNPRHRTLFGPVTISNSYTSLSRQLIVSYLRTHNSIDGGSELVRPKLPLRLTSPRGRETRAFTNLIRDIEELSELISDIEFDQKGIPVLLRHYLKLGGKMVGFSIDRSFSDGLDGLILVDLLRCDAKLLAHYMGEAGAAGFLAYHKEKPLLDLAS